MADTSTLDLFRILCPEFASISDTEVEQWLDVAAPKTNPEYFGACWANAVCYRAAHVMKLMGPGATESDTGAAGPVSSRKAGTRSISWASVSSAIKNATDAYWMSTRYGQAYLQLLNSRSDAAARWINIV